MNTRLRRLTLFVLAALVAAVPVAVSSSSVATMADGMCANGHNWDNVRQRCV